VERFSARSWIALNMLLRPAPSDQHQWHTVELGYTRNISNPDSSTLGLDMERAGETNPPDSRTADNVIHLNMEVGFAFARF
jgi:hypothetical protein